ncbi:hypothetical protein FRB99_004696 [Tulasnella sp. 403]|nr:hypothetical protein FRB99_004696 [Tulasnella sp. 403]
MTYVSLACIHRGLIANLAYSNLLDNPIFSIYLSNQDNDPSSIFFFGGTDKSKYAGELSYHALAFAPTAKLEDLQWIIQSKGILRGNKLVTKPFRALIDTGTLDIIVPYDIAEEFYAQVPGVYLTRDGVWIHPCALRFADIALQFDDNQYAFEAKYLDGSRVRSKPNTCVGVIQGADVELAVIGGSFLKSYYTVYDYRTREIGFAPVVRDGTPDTVIGA